MTGPVRHRSPLRRLLAVAYLPILAIGITVMVGLGWGIYGTAKSVQATQLVTCQTSNQSRHESNLHLRGPLKKAVALAGGGTPQARAKHAAALKRQEALFREYLKTEADPAVRAILSTFIASLAGSPKQTQAYADLAAQIEPVPLIDCDTGKATKVPA